MQLFSNSVCKYNKAMLLTGQSPPNLKHELNIDTFVSIINKRECKRNGRVKV